MGGLIMAEYDYKSAGFPSRRAIRLSKRLLRRQRMARRFVNGLILVFLLLVGGLLLWGVRLRDTAVS
ncbi:MAG: hypothetical protein BLM47_08450 [Candidatus Reconcilbacillus cellulovorans]|uniref:Uncharacterized protein n=1 Tax=Candidatus Reconcilbacillus cellulovorans TaxID=1906605 RepID=A0A2A6DZE3_9BACL|nr:MAG: hypothetical protein BLM47_08450 [Candidatus Reconcilbacillus cellulovorans]